MRALLAALSLCAWQFAGHCLFAVENTAPTPPSSSAALPRTPPTEPAEASSTFQVLHGFTMDLLAAEPLVTDPVAMAYDEDGRAYVCEMNDYPYTDKARHKQNQENPTDQPIGKVRLLVDTEGDGRFDKSTVFAEGLSWPTGVACWKGGVFVAAVPDVWYFKDTDGDGVADVRQKVFSGFRKLNVQAVMNNLVWGLDNRIYGAGSSNGGEVRPGGQPEAAPLVMTRNDFRFEPADPARTLELLSGGARFGNSFDDWGNRFICNIRNPAQHVVLARQYLARNPYLPVASPLNDVGPAGEVPVYRISPVEPWRELRARRWSGQSHHPASELVGAGMVTSSSGITVYRGATYPEQFRGNIFTAEPAGNLLYRQTLTPDGPTFKAERVDAPCEMVASTDLWFRPVNFVNAPDGTLHVCDMYREAIEHPWSIPDDIHAALDLQNGRDRGRIWRLAPPGFRPGKPPRLSGASTAELIALLEDPNAWWRETAQRLLFERQDAAAAAGLRALSQKSAIPLARLHALHALHGLRALTDEDLGRGLSDEAAGIRESSVRLAEPRAARSPALLEQLLALAADPAARVRFQAALTLGEIKDDRTGAALASILRRDAADSWTRTAVLSSAAESCDSLLAALLSGADFAVSDAGREVTRQLAFVVGARNRPAEIARVLAVLPPGDEGRQQIGTSIALGLGDGLKRTGRSLRKAAPDTPAVIALLENARQIAIDEKASLGARAPSVQLLAYDDFERVKASLAALLEARQPQEVQRAAVLALSGFNQAEVAQILLRPWRSYTPSVRGDVVLAMLGSKNRLLPLFDAIDKGEVAVHQIPQTRRMLLLRSKDPEVQARAAKLFRDEPPGSRKAIVEKYQPALTLPGDTARGEKVFEAACMACHRAGDKGTEIGPHLATIRQWSPEQALVNILDPNREVSPNFVDYVIESRDGQIISGIITDETPASITVRRADNVQQTMLRQNVASITSSGRSLMPEGLEAVIDPQQMADLLAFLLGRK